MRVCLVAALAVTVLLFGWLLRPVRPPESRTVQQEVGRLVASPSSGASSSSTCHDTGRRESERNNLGARPPNAATQPSVADLMEENRKLRATNALLQERLQALLNWILANFRGRFPIPEALFSRVQIAPLTDDDVLNPEIVELLRLSADDVARLNDAFAYATDYLSDIEATILTASEPRKGKIILHIPTFRENGQLLKDDLYAALEATLGSDRFARFRKVAETGLLRRFYHFGEASRTMVFELTYEENDPHPRILIKDGYILEIEPGVREITATEMVATNIPAKYAAYLAWLPDYFTTPEHER